MTNCCSSTCTTDTPSRKHRCPVNGKQYTEVSATTIMHHIKEPWLWKEKNQRYYFCADPECDVVYFGQDDSVIEKSELRIAVGIKEKSKNAMVCYCFGIIKNEAINSQEARAFVVQKTKENSCACETRNPSGRCCLKGFPKR